MDVATQIIANLGVAGVFLAIAYVVATQTLPRVFDTIIVEMRTKREEFLSALKDERTARLADREAFLAALTAERQASAVSLARLEAKFETSLEKMSNRIGELTEAVNDIVERSRGIT